MALIRSHMGHGAKDNRRALVATVEGCIRQTNDMTALATEVREANNALAAQTVADVTALRTRCDALGAWCKRLEAELIMEQRFRRLTRSELPQLTIEQSAFAGMTFLERVTWFFTGRWPKPATFEEVVIGGTITATSDKPTAITMASGDYGRMSAGMAPRPLP